MNPALLALTLGAMLLGMVMLGFTITRTVGLVKSSVIVRLPVLAEQSVDFERAGTFTLNLEYPRLSTALLHAEFSLRDAGDREVPSWPIVFRTVVSGFSVVRFPVRGYAIAHPGRYRLIASGIATASDSTRCALLFTRPYTATLVLLILGIVFGGICCIGGLVFSALQFAGKL
ncbi:MAG: hypothetical protein JWR16_2696 [Nevskia sp.]|nr:hypothetical protein [Nevskia sp.]